MKTTLLYIGLFLAFFWWLSRNRKHSDTAEYDAYEEERAAKEQIHTLASDAAILYQPPNHSGDLFYGSAAMVDKIVPI